MAKFSRRGQWGIILGAYFGNQLLRALAQANPNWAPWILPLRILYIVFALMTWIASPLFNLLLRLNPFGRMVLSQEQIVASNWIGGVLLLALLSLAGGCVYGFNSPWIIAALIFGLLLLPVAGTFRCPAGSTRTIMGVYTGIAGFTGVAAIILFFLSSSQSDPEAMRGAGAIFFMISLLGSVASSWIVNILLTQRRRR
jgi:hypothetical protein